MFKKNLCCILVLAPVPGLAVPSVGCSCERGWQHWPVQEKAWQPLAAAVWSIATGRASTGAATGDLVMCAATH